MHQCRDHMDVKERPYVLCRYFYETPQAHLSAMDGGNAEKCLEHFLPCGLYDSFHAAKTRSRIYTYCSKSKIILSILTYLGKPLTRKSLAIEKLI